MRTCIKTSNSEQGLFFFLFFFMGELEGKRRINTVMAVQHSQGVRGEKATGIKKGRRRGAFCNPRLKMDKFRCKESVTLRDSDTFEQDYLSSFPPL